MPNQPQPTIVLEELNGQKRRIELSGRAVTTEMPEYGVKQRNDKTWNPGSPKATVQVSGPEFHPIKLKGTWRDRDIAGDNPAAIARVNGRQVDSAEQIASVMESVCIQGQQVRYSWGRVVRYGIVEEFKAKPNRTIHDIEWDLEFNVIGIDDAAPNPRISRQQGVGGFASGLSQKSQALRDLVDNLPPEIRNGDLTQRVRGYVSDVESTVESVKDAVSGYVGNVLSSSQSVRRVAGLAGKTVSDVQNMINETQNQVYRELLGYPELAQATMGEGVAAAAWAREVADNGGDVKTRAVEFRNDAQVTMSNEVMTLHTVREGEDFRTISKRYYGDDGGWRRIMVYNGYDSMSVPVGVEVIVPRKSNNEVS